MKTEEEHRKDAEGYRFVYPYELVNTPAKIILLDGRLVELSKGFRLKRLNDLE